MENNSKYSKHIVTDRVVPDEFNNPKLLEELDKRNRLILWLDDKIVPGAFQMNCCWYLAPMEMTDVHHHEIPEIIGFFGNDPQNPNDLGGEIEFWLEEEMFTITKSAMIFVPPGMTHCPLIVKRVDRPIFHYSTILKGEYDMKH